MPKQRNLSHRITRSNTVFLQKPKERCCICFNQSYGVHFYNKKKTVCNHGCLHCHTCAKQMFARNNKCSLCRKTVTNVKIEDVRCKKCNAITRGVSMMGLPDISRTRQLTASSDYVLTPQPARGSVRESRDSRDAARG